WRARAPRAPRIAASAARCFVPTYTMMSGAPTAAASRSVPSMTRCGRVAIKVRSLRLSGSPSAPLARTTARPLARLATARHFRPTGNAAPPRPSRLADSSSPIRCRLEGMANGPAGPPSSLAIGGHLAPGGRRNATPPPGNRQQDAADADRVDPEHPGEARVAAGPKAVDGSNRPHRIGEPVHEAPAAISEQRAEQAGRHDRDQQVHSDHAETEPERPVRG